MHRNGGVLVLRDDECNGRLNVLEFMLNIAEEYSEHMCSRTVYMDMALCDYYLSLLTTSQQISSPDRRRRRRSSSASRSSSCGARAQSLERRLKSDVNWLLLGATCIHVASKGEDISSIGIKDLSERMSDGFHEPEEILLLEESMLNLIDFELHIPTGMWV